MSASRERPFTVVLAWGTVARAATARREWPGIVCPGPPRGQRNSVPPGRTARIGADIMPAPFESDRAATSPDALDGAAAASPAARSARALARLALLAIVIVAAAGFYAWFDMRRDVTAMREDVAQRLA